MSDDHRTLTLIGADLAPAGAEAPAGQRPELARPLFEKKIDAKALERRLHETMVAVSETVKGACQGSPLAWPLAAVTVALSVSMSGSIGIASAGSTVAIQLTFAPSGAAAPAAETSG